MGVTYRKNPVNLALVNPDEPPRPKGKGGKKKMARTKGPSKTRVGYPKRKKTASQIKAERLRNLAKARSAKKRKAQAAGTRKEKTRLSPTQLRAVRLKNLKKARAAKKAKARRSGSVSKKSAPKASKTMALAQKAIRTAERAEKTAKKAAKKSTTSKPRKSTGAKRRKMPERYKSGPKKGQFKPSKRSSSVKGRKRAATTKRRKGWKQAGAKKPPKPRKKPTREGQYKADHSVPWRKGRPKPGWYSEQTGLEWNYRKNPGVKIMPNGTLLDPSTNKFVSPRSARGRQLLMGGGGRGMGSWLSNPMSSVMGTAESFQDIAMQALKSGAVVGIGFFGARAMANLASMSTWVPASVAPYAPMLAQIAAGGVAYYGLGRYKPEYRAEALAGVGLSILEALMRRFVPEGIQEYTSVPDPGLGADLSMYRRALAGYGEGLDEGWGDTYPGDAAILGALSGMGEYVLPEELPADFDIGMGEYLPEDDVDPVFDIHGGMGEFVTVDSLAPEFDLGEGMGEFVTVDSLDPVYDLSGYEDAEAEALAQIEGLGDVQEISAMARRQIAMGEANITDTPVITNSYGPPGAGGIFGDSKKSRRARLAARDAARAARKSGKGATAAAQSAYKAAVANGAQAPEAKQIAVEATKAVWTGKEMTDADGEALLDVGDYQERLPNEEDAREFRTGIFRDAMFDALD